jgi:hypothetical protein
MFEKILQALSTTDLRKRGWIELSECFMDDGTFIVAKKKGERDWKGDQAEGQRYEEAHGNIR